MIYRSTTWQREVNFNTQAFAVVVIQHVERSELTAVRQAVVHEVD